MSQGTSVLVVEDVQGLGGGLATVLARGGHAVTVARSGAEALERVAAGAHDVIFADPAVCEHLLAASPDAPVVVVTTERDWQTAMTAIRAGAYDLVIVPVQPEALDLAIERAVRHRQLREEVRRLRRFLDHTGAVEEVVGESAVVKRLYEQIDRLAATDVQVLILGERGTGKELAARAMHQRSRRARGPFVPVHCGALPDAPLESELFGPKGLLFRAAGGTLYLDEVGAVPSALEPRLVQALTRRRVTPSGAEAEVAVDVRIIAASSEDIGDAASFYRMGALSLVVPPLRSRGKDVLLLAQAFIRQFAARAGREVSGLTPAAAERLLTYHWPGNVRELRDCIERAVSLATGPQISFEDLPERIRTFRGWQMLTSRANLEELVPIAELERRYILHVLEVVGGSRTLAARTLGLDRKTLYRRLEQYGIQPERPRRRRAG